MYIPRQDLKVILSITFKRMNCDNLILPVEVRNNKQKAKTYTYENFVSQFLYCVLNGQSALNTKYVSLLLPNTSLIA